MALFTSMSAETKTRIVTGQKEQALERIYIYLLRLGINPETFNEATYTPADEADLDEGEVYNQRELVSALEEIELLNTVEASF